MLESLWTRLLSSLEHKIPEAALDTWVRSSRLMAVEGDRLQIAAPNKFSRDWLGGHHLPPPPPAPPARLAGGTLPPRPRRGRPGLPRGKPPGLHRGGRDARPRTVARRRRGAAGANLHDLRAQPPLHVRDVCRRLVQPVRPGGLPGRGRTAPPGLQTGPHA